MTSTAWPSLPYPPWRDTATTLQLWTQVVGKVRIALAPWLNHGWHVALYVTSRGLATSPMPVAGGLLEIEFDFVVHELVCRTSQGGERRLRLEPRTVADFHAAVLGALSELDVDVAIDGRPNEIEHPIPFAEDRTHRSYDAEAAQRFWRALVAMVPAFERYRTGFIGKSSPVHFFWGSFDLALTRFSGRKAPPHPGGVPNLPDQVTREAYSHEVASAGFWPGNERHPEPAFYAYAYPQPAGYRERTIGGGARFEAVLGEWILPYDAVRAAADPQATLLGFLQAAYESAADLGGWDRANLECDYGHPRRPRPV